MHRNPLCACYIPLPLPSNLMHLKTCMRMCNGLLKGICAFRRWMFYMCWPIIMLKSYNKDFFVSKQYLNLIVNWRELFVYALTISPHSIFSTLMSYTNMLWRCDWHFILKYESSSYHEILCSQKYKFLLNRMMPLIWYCINGPWRIFFQASFILHLTIFDMP